jgi:hypothetical protein
MSSNDILTELLDEKEALEKLNLKVTKLTAGEGAR